MATDNEKIAASDVLSTGAAFVEAIRRAHQLGLDVSISGGFVASAIFACDPAVGRAPDAGGYPRPATEVAARRIIITKTERIF